MKKLLLLLLITPLFFSCGDDEEENNRVVNDNVEWIMKEYNFKVEVTNEPNGVYYYHGNKTKERQKQTGLNKERDFVEYTIKPEMEEVSFVVFESGKNNIDKFNAKLFLDGKLIVEGNGMFDGNITDVIRFTYNFKTKEVKTSYSQK